MLGDYLRSFWLGVTHNKLTTFINVGGLALGLAVFFALILNVQREFSWDGQWEDASRIYLAAGAVESPAGNTDAVFTNASWVIGSSLKNRNSDAFETFARVFVTQGTVGLAGQNFPGTQLSYAEPGLLDLIQLETLEGSLAEVFADPRAIAVNVSDSEKYFGTDSPMGRTLSIDLPHDVSLDYVVKAVYRLPQPSTLNYLHFLALLDPAVPPQPDLGTDIWVRSPVQLQDIEVRHYFKLREGFDVAALEADLRNFMDQGGYLDFGSYKLRYSFRLLSDEHLYQNQINPMDGGAYVQRLWIQAAVGVLVLLISGCNFVMLATLHSVDRMREVGIRKTVGGEAVQLLRQYLTDAFCQTLVAAVLAVALLELALPRLQLLLGLPLELDLMTWSSMGLCMLIVVAFALVSGLYPALLMARGKPVSLLRNSSNAVAGGGSALRKLLVGIQFTVVIVLLLASTVVQQQIEYTSTRGPGYSLDDMVALRVNDLATLEKIPTLLAAFARVPGVLATSSGGASPGTASSVHYQASTVALDGTVAEAALGPSTVGAGYFDLMSVPMLAGREFSQELDATEADGEARKAVLNEAAVYALGFSTPQDAVDQLINVNPGVINGQQRTQSLRVIGVISDVQFTSVLVPPQPEYYQYRPSNGFLIVKLQAQADATAVKAALEEVWHGIVGDLPFVPTAWDVYVENQLRREKFEASLVIGSTVLAMVIALLGLYGLAAASVVKRVKEIGVRKVMGADAIKIIALMLWQFSQPVVVANLVAWPLGYWLVLQWLERFPYRLDTAVIVLSGIAASALALCIAWLTVGILAARAANAKPVLSLRYE